MGVIAPAPAPTTAKPRALVVNAEPQFLIGLTIVLRGAGHVMESARTGPEALAVVANDPPAVLVLDAAQADGTGVELCEGVRRVSKVPILVISLVGSEREKTLALNAGADDYVSKPFRAQDLLDRLRSVAPASAELPPSSPLEVGELLVDLARRRVRREGAILLLEPAEFELVRVLAERRGRPVTDRQLLGEAWGSEPGQGTHRLRIRMARLRAKLERDPSQPTHLITETGIGYRLRGFSEVVR